MYSSGGGGSSRPAVYDGKIAGLYDLEETLGSGHFAVVKLARHVFTGEKVAVKVIDKNKLDEVSRAHLFQEVRCMKLVQHPHVVRLYEVIDTQTKLYLILELGDGGDLYDYIMKHDSGLSEDLAREYFRQIVRAISFCHQLHVVHRDLKPENVLFFEKLGVVKLTDFGFSNKFCPGQKLQTSCGSLAYSAPEILLGDSYDAPAVDVWSLGVILYMLVCGQPPFQEANDSETLTMIMDCKYSVPAHVSPDCQDLISRMLVRQPENRATLKEIAEDKWLSEDGLEYVPECLPLVSREEVSEEDHNLILQKMVNGNIAAKEEILDALDKNEYNHITATYFLLAERKLRSHRQEMAQKRRPELSLPVNANSALKSINQLPTQDANLLMPSSAGHLNALLTPGADGTASGRARKCSIVQEEDDDEDDAERDELQSSLNRRGSRSEGRINIAVADRIAESELLKKDMAIKTVNAAMAPARGVFDGIFGVTLVSSGDNDLKERLGRTRNLGNVRRPMDFRPRTAIDTTTTTTIKDPSNVLKGNGIRNLANLRSSSVDHSYSALNQCHDTDAVSTKFLTDAATVSLPIQNQEENVADLLDQSKYKTMPSPTRANTILPGSNCLNEIFEEGTDIGSSDTSTTTTPRPTVRHTTFTANSTRTPPPTNVASAHRRTKFHKTRTASCSSSDDDDSENRKKRAHKIVDTHHKTIQQQRRDSNDDSSDSQDPGSGATANSNSSSQYSIQAIVSGNNEQGESSSGQTNGGNSGTNGTQKSGQVGYRRHRAGRRRTGETRLRESQSLNRITEVQESEAPLASLANQQHQQSTASSQTPNISQSTAPATAPNVSNSSLNASTASQPKSNKMGFSARLFHGFRKSDSHATNVPLDHDETCAINTHTKNSTSTTSINSTSTNDVDLNSEFAKTIKVTAEGKSSAAAKKLKLLGKYFQVHKKICIPLPGIFQRGRLYKAQSCSSIIRDKINHGTMSSNKTGAVTPKARHSVFYNDKIRITTSNGIDPRLLASAVAAVETTATANLKDSH